MSFDWHIVLFARSFIALILLIGGSMKLFDTSQFVEVVRSYQLLPDAAVKWVGRLIPVWEIVLGVALIVSVRPVEAAVAAGLTFLVFGSAMAINLVRGRYYISCGCFGANEDRHVSWKLVISDAMFAVVALLSLPILQSPAAESVRSETVLTVLLAVVAVACWWLGGVILDVRRLPPVVVGPPAHDAGKEH